MVMRICSRSSLMGIDLPPTAHQWEVYATVLAYPPGTATHLYRTTLPPWYSYSPIPYPPVTATPLVQLPTWYSYSPIPYATVLPYPPGTATPRGTATHLYRTTLPPWYSYSPSTPLVQPLTYTILPYPPGTATHLVPPWYSHSPIPYYPTPVVQLLTYTVGQDQRGGLEPGRSCVNAVDVEHTLVVVQYGLRVDGDLGDIRDRSFLPTTYNKRV